LKEKVAKHPKREWNTKRGSNSFARNIRIHKPGNLHDPYIALYRHDEIRVLSPNSSLLLEIRILLKYAFYLRKIMLGFL
jgi:hypothetical protein